MSTLLVRVLAVSCLIIATGCASRQKKTSSRIYEGDAPNIKFLEKRESAGGPVGGR